MRSVNLLKIALEAELLRPDAVLWAADEARQWVEAEGRALAAPVEWLEH